MQKDAHMKALVSGGVGFMGSHVVYALLARNCEVVVLDDLSGGFEDIEIERNLPPSWQIRS